LKFRTDRLQLSQEVKVKTADGHHMVLDAEFVGVCGRLKDEVEGEFGGNLPIAICFSFPVVRGTI
jgi:hypothetical protein